MRITILLVALAALTAEAQPRPEHGLHFTRAVTTWDEAVPLGNGMVGALLWGDGQPVKLSLDRADLWDLRPVPEFHTADYTFSNVLRLHREGKHADLKRMLEDPYNRPAPTKIPAGRIEITMPSDARFASTSLDVAAARGAMEFANGDRLDTFVHATQAFGMVDIQTHGEPKFHLVPPPFSGRVDNAAQGGISPGDLSQLGYPAPKVEHGNTFETYTQQGWGGFRFAVHLAWRRHLSGYTVGWSISSSAEGADPAKIAQARVAEALRLGYASVVDTTHAQWWKQFWNQSTLRVPNAALERMWHLETYKFGAASRRDSPPITLQAVWTADNGQLPP